ncbi:carbohydrate ABC transporter permease [Deinococcus malanensis]|uniref:carbohydrate ABC transporter permease n=1 Tax=Deinococcus malanensis TaxID=1706855 RepID=UPI00362B27F6
MSQVSAHRTGRAPGQPNRRSAFRARQRAMPWMFLAPFLLLFTIFYVAPVFYAGYLSLFIKKRGAFGPARDVFGGLANYVRAFQDSDFLVSLWNILKFGLVQVPLMVVLALTLALILDGVRGGSRACSAPRSTCPTPFPV